MLLEADGEPTGIPHTVQAMISARIDRLPVGGEDGAPARRRRGAHVLVGRGRGARRRHRSEDGGLEELVERDFLVREPRSTIRGEEAYRFKHVLIRDVAYAGLSKSSRALLHRQMAQWLAGPPGGGRARRDPCLPPRRGRAARGRARGARAAPSSRAEAAAALEQAGRRALAREANAVARRLLVRASRARADARTALPRRPGGLADDRHPDRLDRDARRQRGGARGGRRPDRGAGADRARAGGAVPRRRQRPRARARRTARSPSSRRPTTSGRFDALEVLGTVWYWEGDLDEVERLATERLAIAERIGRSDLQSGVLLELNDIYNAAPRARARLRAAARARSSSRARAAARRRGGGSCARPGGRRRSRGGSTKPRRRSSRRGRSSPRAVPH